MVAMLGVMLLYQQRDAYRERMNRPERMFQAYLAKRGENCTLQDLPSDIARFKPETSGAYISHEPNGVSSQRVIKLGEPGVKINLFGFDQYKNKLVAIVDPRYCASVIYQTTDYASEIDLSVEKPWSLDQSFVTFEGFLQVIVLENGPQSFEPVFQYTERRRLYSIGYSRGAMENRDTEWAKNFYSDEFKPETVLPIDYVQPKSLDEWVVNEREWFFKNNGYGSL